MPLPAQVNTRKYQGQIFRNIVQNEGAIQSMIKKNSVSPQSLRNLNSENLNAELKSIAAQQQAHRIKSTLDNYDIPATQEGEKRLMLQQQNLVQKMAQVKYKNKLGEKRNSVL
jgi:crotonobetainyl-CoA:carnitine CoA-transferase CaiB-like acyl-CoA transferase